MGESAEDLLLADLALSKVDRSGWPGADLSRGELAEGTVRPRCVVVPQVLLQHPVGFQNSATGAARCNGSRTRLAPSGQVIRMSKLRIKVSGCMRSMKGVETFWAIRSYLATAARHGIRWLDALTRAAEGHPWISATE